jgi:hypothetical protein
MNAGTWGKNTIAPRGRGIEKPREVTLTFNLLTDDLPGLGSKGGGECPLLLIAILSKINYSSKKLIYTQ